VGKRGQGAPSVAYDGLARCLKSKLSFALCRYGQNPKVQPEILKILKNSVGFSFIKMQKPYTIFAAKMVLLT
jgi:hypothetical protein